MTDQGDRTRVLLVDDEVDFLDASAKALSRRGFDVATARSGEEALALLGQRGFDAAVLDVRMPGLSGDELFREIKAQWPDVPVLMLTGHGTLQHAFKTSRDGVVEYLCKPCDMEALSEALRRVLSAPPPHATVSAEVAFEEPIELLIVDDEEDLLESFSKSLTRRGMQVTTAESAADARLLIDRRRFGVVLLDLRLPGESGLDLLRVIREVQPDAEIIVLTGHPSLGTAIDGIRSGAFDYLAKPVAIEALVSKIRAAHQRRGQQSEARRKQEVAEILAENPD